MGMDGLTLVEIVVVVAIAAILLALAVPSYQGYLQRGHRADAIRGLMEVASCQERVRSERGFYDTGRCIGRSGTAFYRLRIEPVAQAQSLVYKVIASPIKQDRNDYCGELSLDQAGVRGISGDADQLVACWGGR
jgi:type IV pilus assembly protein PilE